MGAEAGPFRPTGGRGSWLAPQHLFMANWHASPQLPSNLPRPPPDHPSLRRGFSTSWDVYFEQLQPLASAMPYMTTIGNHERDWPASGDVFDGAVGAVTDSGVCQVEGRGGGLAISLPLLGYHHHSDAADWPSHAHTHNVLLPLPRTYPGGECGVPYERRLAMPTPAPDEPWYSFDMGPVHFLQCVMRVVLDGWLLRMPATLRCRPPVICDDLAYDLALQLRKRAHTIACFHTCPQVQH